jgi:hypothetical protein
MLWLAIGAALVGFGESRAATVTYDLAGESAEQTRIDSPPGYYSIPFSAGSSLTLEFDANDDGTSGDVTIASSNFGLQGTHSAIFGSITLTTDFEAALSGGLGTLDALGSFIEWSEPASYSVAGSFYCLGSNCTLINLTDGAEYSYVDYQALFGVGVPGVDHVSFLSSIPLGLWQLNQSEPGDLDFICVSYDGHICAPPLPTALASGLSSEWLIGLDLHGQAVPEPATAWLVAGGVLALALRRRGSLRGRSSDTMRRHEVA